MEEFVAGINPGHLVNYVVRGKIWGIISLKLLFSQKHCKYSRYFYVIIAIKVFLKCNNPISEFQCKIGEIWNVMIEAGNDLQTFICFETGFGAIVLFEWMQFTDVYVTVFCDYII